MSSDKSQSDESDGEGVYEVEKILHDKISKGAILYYVKWKGFLINLINLINYFI